MSFKEDIGDYKTFVDTNQLYYKTVPYELWKELGSFISKCIDEDNYGEILRGLSNASLISTSNLMGDFEYFVDELKRKVNNNNLPMLYDCLGVLAINISNGQNEINNFLLRHSIGYRCNYEYPYFELYWEAIDDNLIISKINDTSKKVIPYSVQASQELDRVKKTLEDAENDERARKDAVRSALSSFEALVKNVAENENEVNKAIDKLKNIGKWKKEILQYGKTLWHDMHELYPDLRHGSIDKSNMDYDEAKYWIDKIINYSKYLISKV